VHRDVRPANLFVKEGRYVLTGFSLARRSADSDTSSTGAQSRATGYRAPEVAAGGESTPRSDLDAAALVIYQALTGRHWPGQVLPGVWNGVPFGVGRVLRRALANQAVDRWPDAPGFRAALEQAGRMRPSRRAMVVTVAVALGLGGVIGRQYWRPAPPEPLAAELAILPFEVTGDRSDSTLGADLAHLAQLNLDNVPGLLVTPRRQIVRWLSGPGNDVLGGDRADVARALNTRWVASGQVIRTGRALKALITVYDSMGANPPLPILSGSIEGLPALADTLALTILGVVAPRLVRVAGRSGGLGGHPIKALKNFLQGEAAFARDHWSRAEGLYQAASDADSTFALAEWRLANVKRWRRLPYDPDLAGLYRHHRDRLRPLDRLLIEALLES
ncbi:MAG: hypothetical protein ACREMG_01370, partial [Gemmatimonadales bacterium]